MPLSYRPCAALALLLLPALLLWPRAADARGGHAAAHGGAVVGAAAVPGGSARHFAHRSGRRFATRSGARAIVVVGRRFHVRAHRFAALSGASFLPLRVAGCGPLSAGRGGAVLLDGDFAVARRPPSFTVEKTPSGVVVVRGSGSAAVAE
jgi:hypothetical protein